MNKNYFQNQSLNKKIFEINKQKLFLKLILKKTNQSSNEKNILNQKNILKYNIFNKNRNSLFIFNNNNIKIV